MTGTSKGRKELNQSHARSEASVEGMVRDSRLSYPFVAPTTPAREVIQKNPDTTRFVLAWILKVTDLPRFMASLQEGTRNMVVIESIHNTPACMQKTNE